MPAIAYDWSARLTSTKEEGEKTDEASDDIAIQRHRGAWMGFGKAYGPPRRPRSTAFERGKVAAQRGNGTGSGDTRSMNAVLETAAEYY